MKKFGLLFSVVLGIFMFHSCRLNAQNQPVVSSQVAPQVAPQMYVHKNLAICLIEGSDQISRKYMTLEEAMDKKLIVLHETGSVNELSVDNLSKEYVFILSGDIVKGGQQDRTIAEDIILLPGCKKTPLKSFCVEHNRWQQRQSESVTQFSSSKKMLSNKNLKVAARDAKEQGKVWKEVSSFQDNASRNVQADVKSSVSSSSLQLTLENKTLQTTVDEYLKSLASCFSGKTNVLGFVFCVNGKISTVEYFGNSGLFSQLRTKLLESAANEAVFAYDEKRAIQNPSVEEIRAFIQAAGKGKVTENKTGEFTLEKSYKTRESILFRTYDTQVSKELPVHTSIYSTDGLEDKADKQSRFQYGGHNARN